MAKRLPVPPELEHLIEKREQEADRRLQERRSDSDPLQDVPGPASGEERRKINRRKEKRRRKSN